MVLEFIPSSPLIKTTSVTHPHSVESWLSNPKEERGDTKRKYAAIPIYLRVAGLSLNLLPQNSFPAQFDFSDRQTKYPDKALVKTLLEKELIVGRQHSGELVFELTERGQDTFPNQQASA